MSIEKTETRLMNKAVHYLGRYSASEQRLREVLSRFATRKLADIEPAEVASAMTRVVEKCQRLGYVDDVTFAASQARSQRRQGKSTMAIRQRLRQHALDDAAIAMALHTRTPIIKMPNWRQPSILPDAAGWDLFSKE